MEAEKKFPIALRHDRVVIIVLEDVQELGKNRQITPTILILHKRSKGFKGKQTVKVIRGPGVKTLTWLQISDFGCEPPEVPLAKG